MTRGGKRTRSGPAPTPTALRALRGQPKKNCGEPIPAPGFPARPKHLSGFARDFWNAVAPQLEALGVAAASDVRSFELLCFAYADYRECREVIKKEGRTYTTEGEGGVMVRPRPEVAMASDAWRRFASMAAEFGLTPSSRTKVGVIATKESDPFEEYLRRGEKQRARRIAKAPIPSTGL